MSHLDFFIIDSLSIYMNSHQFGGNVEEKFVVNAIGNPYVLDGFNDKRYVEEKVAVKSSSKSKTEKGGAFGGIVEKGDGVSSALLCLI